MLSGSLTATSSHSQLLPCNSGGLIFGAQCSVIRCFHQVPSGALQQIWMKDIHGNSGDPKALKDQLRQNEGKAVYLLKEHGDKLRFI